MREIEKTEPASLRLRADAVLVLVTVVWGSSFVVVKNVLRDSPPLTFLFVRFLLAAAVCALLLPGRRRTPRLFRDGAIVGGLLAGGMVLQVLGQVQTTASKAAFLTGLSVVMTPFAAFARTRGLPSFENALGIVLAGSGFFLLAFPAGGVPVNRGDLAVFGCAVVFAFFIVELSARTPAHDPVWLTFVQLSVVAATAAVLAASFRIGKVPVEMRPLLWSGGFLGAVAYLATIGTVGTFLSQTWAQRHISATHAAILYSLEPVWAALLAAWLLRERLGARGAWGAALVLAGIVASELRLRVGLLRRRGN